MSDRKIGVSTNGTSVDYFSSEILSASDYFVFGKKMNGRNFNSNAYPMSFNGKRDDAELGLIDFDERMYNGDLGRFLTRDPLFKKYADLSPYCYAANIPIKFQDVKGMGPGDLVIIFPGADMSSQPQTATSVMLFNIISNADPANVIKPRSIFFTRTEASIINSTVKQIQEVHKANPEGKIIIYGYSFGGKLANKLAKQLDKLNIDVDLLITVDAANGRGSDNLDREISKNVKKNVNYYEKNIDGIRDPTKSHGDANKSSKKDQIENHDKSNDTYIGEKIDHMNIDNATVIEAATLILKELKAPTKKK